MNNLHEIINNNSRLLQVLFLLKQQGIETVHIQCKECIPDNGRYIKGFFSPETENITLCKDTIESNEELTTILAHELIHMLDYQRGNQLNSPENILLSEYRAAYYGDCYTPSSSISFIRKSCIIQHGKECTKNAIAINGIPYKEIYQQCVESIQKDQNIITNNQQKERNIPKIIISSFV